MAKKKVSIQHIYKSLATLQTANPLLLNGQVAYYVDDTGRNNFRIGDGVTLFNDLPPFLKDPYNRTEANLLQDGSDQWYLPVLDDDDSPIAANAVFVIYNGLSLPGAQLDTINTPNRIYGFINNEAATIKVTVL